MASAAEISLTRSEAGVDFTKLLDVDVTLEVIRQIADNPKHNLLTILLFVLKCRDEAKHREASSPMGNPHSTEENDQSSRQRLCRGKAVGHHKESRRENYTELH